MASRYQILLYEEQRDIDPNSCSKGGEHQWGTDGAHSNEFCKKCFIDKPGPVREVKRSNLFGLKIKP